MRENVGLVPYGVQPTPIGSPPIVEQEGIPWRRYFEALRRHALMILAFGLAGSALGFMAARRVRHIYEAQSTVWIASAAPAQSGPIRPQQLLPAGSWVELLKSYSIVEPVVKRMRLNVNYTLPTDSVFFTSFESLPNIRPGAYVLTVSASGRYTLSDAKEVVIERGTIGDSIGRSLGFGWAPSADLFAKTRMLRFSVATPRSVSLGLVSSLRTSLPEDGQFLTIMLSGPSPDRVAHTLNAWVEEFVSSSTELKKRHLLEFKQILGDQLAVAGNQLQSSENQLQQFRERNITLPATGGGVATTATEQYVGGFFQQKSALAEVQTERTALEQLLASSRGRPLDPQSFLMLPTILTESPQLRAAIDDLSSRQAALRSEKQFLTDANPRIKQLSEGVRVLQMETIPQIVQSLLEGLRARERNISSHIDAQSSELRTIPARMIEDARLVRQVAASENLYTVLKARYEEVALQEAETAPDLSVLDYAVPPTHPNSNDAPRLLLLAIVASFGAAIGLALFHDRIDRRFRYPEQATRDLGLTIAGTVPLLRAKRAGEFQIELMSQVVESFRTLRLAVKYEFPADAPVVLAVSSPSASDGKSLVSSNLALAFASAGHRTLLIDGDLRRGTLHSAFGMPVLPGLVEYLSNGMPMDSVIKATTAENLYMIARGSRVARAPELLVSDRMQALIDMARRQFEVVIIDSPPFVAGVDAYALAAATGNILVVLRQGFSDRKLAAAKLAIVDRLPIRFLGTVINGVPEGGMYKYYGTDYSAGNFGGPTGNIATPGGLVVGA
ncbi:MAG TPA: polysaccharide biosynthesis tyrosine autokinase [Gemmatimonadaceae bacterium]|nr:polysaccharide biosynthesis tyrosine autokinase [Gemmatimonadaceae bacterium]